MGGGQWVLSHLLLPSGAWSKCSQPFLARGAGHSSCFAPLSALWLESPLCFSILCKKPTSSRKPAIHASSQGLLLVPVGRWFTRHAAARLWPPSHPSTGDSSDTVCSFPPDTVSPCGLEDKPFLLPGCPRGKGRAMPKPDLCGCLSTSRPLIEHSGSCCCRPHVSLS